MMTALRYLCLFVPALLLAAGMARTRREKTAALLATLIAVPLLLAVHLLALRFHWWHFAAAGGTLAGFPIDVWAGWAILWGAVPLLLAPHLRWWELALIAFLFDLAFMPQIQPLLVLDQRKWLLGEAVAIGLGLLPAQLFARWTRDGTAVASRVILQALAFAGWCIVIPVLAITEYLHAPVPVFAWVALLPGLVGFAAAMEFATRGHGTPVPMDPPKHLVVTGPYAYVRNPMQLSMCVVVPMALAFITWWAGLIALALLICYSVGLAEADERLDLDERFGDAWQSYATAVPRWRIRWRPWRKASAQVYVAADSCQQCAGVARLIQHLKPTGLEILPAEEHPARDLTRITYEDGEYSAEGMAAVARVLEHVHLGWAALGWIVMLPGLLPLIQAVVDVSGGHPRQIPRRTKDVNRLTPPSCTPIQ